MYRNVRQVGFVTVFQSFGPSPLEQWDLKVKTGGFARRVTDEQVRALALELSSTNVSTCFIRCPRHPRASLGIYMNYLVMIIKGMNKYFTFEITVLDDRNVQRRFRMSNFEKRVRVQHFSTSMPLCLKPGWNEICFDLAEFTRKAYKSNYVEATRIQIHANCRIRVIYFCDKIYKDELVPHNLKIFLPTDHVGRRKSKEEEVITKKEESIVFTSYEDEYEEEGAGEEMYFGGSMKSVEASLKESKAASSDGHRSMIIMLGGGDEGMEGYYDDADYQDHDVVGPKVEGVEGLEEKVDGEQKEEEEEEEDKGDEAAGEAEEVTAEEAAEENEEVKVEEAAEGNEEVKVEEA